MALDYQNVAEKPPPPSPKKLTIAIQGTHGAFHEIAARSFHPNDDIEVVPADTFVELVRKVETGETDAAVMAIENTIAGSLLGNYNLLNESDLRIRGEVFLRIKQNLMALKGVKIEDLKSVQSHPIALQQCVEFFQQYPHIKLVEATDTALVAKQIQEKGARKMGAVASTLAAEMYDMDLLAESIETYKKNYTRFLYLTKNEVFTDSVNQDASKHLDNLGQYLPSDIRHPTSDISNTEGVHFAQKSFIVRDFNKVSTVFTTKHTVGSLHKALETLAANGCNLTKIQSAPIMDKPWEYMFFMDFTLDDRSNYIPTMNALKAVTGELRILGEYKLGKYVE
jgi:prephenate dehydratase